jgi:hypothetical protein
MLWFVYLFYFYWCGWSSIQTEGLGVIPKLSSYSVPVSIIDYFNALQMPCISLANNYIHYIIWSRDVELGSVLHPSEVLLLKTLLWRYYL